ncbi:MAG: N-acetyltransferase [Armatimonadetes bacterium]|nr:N-acetyltransferase [Armatimonadota bacterium]
MTIRTESEDDFPLVRELVKAAFETAHVSSGDEQNYVDRVRESDAYLPELSLVAEDEGELIGHIMLSRMSIVRDDGSDLATLTIAPVSVTPARQNQGVGTSLMQEAMRLAREAGHKSVLLVGDPAYYHRFGFRTTADFGLRSTQGIPDENVMACELVPQALQGVSGTITFST